MDQPFDGESSSPVDTASISIACDVCMYAVMGVVRYVPLSPLSRTPPVKGALGAESQTSSRDFLPKHYSPRQLKVWNMTLLLDGTCSQALQTVLYLHTVVVSRTADSTVPP